MINVDSLPIVLLKDIYIILNSFENEPFKYSVVNLIDSILGEEESVASRKILKLFSGGMNSFNDLVLQENGQVQSDRMKEFSELRKRLFQWAIKNLGKLGDVPRCPY